MARKVLSPDPGKPRHFVSRFRVYQLRKLALTESNSKMKDATTHVLSRLASRKSEQVRRPVVFYRF
jgi:hypothetical protein